MDRTMRVGAYGILTDDAGNTLMQRSTELSQFAGAWWIPGGGVEHSEDPADAVVREFAEETGLDVEITGLRSVTSTVVPMTSEWSQHNTLVLYEVKATGGALRDDFDNGEGRNLWTPLSRLSGELMSPKTSTMLNLPGRWPAPTNGGRAPEPPPGMLLEQRVGAYAWLTRPDGKVLLTMIPPGYWAAGLWHLPGGGVDFGETPEEGLLREVYEETSQRAELTGLRGLVSRHDPESVTPDGRPSNFHGINIIWGARIEEETPLRILDVGGSTSDLRWFDVDEIADLPKTVAVEAGLSCA
ncbi:NUDIX hydrolase [Stackebrandtia endophytica]|nr:NUDIX domain-containing protein [Stackebrandtia endophytica]